MPKTIRITNIPDQVLGILKSRAAREGISLSDFVKKELARAAERPTMEEWMEWGRSRSLEQDVLDTPDAPVSR